MKLTKALNIAIPVDRDDGSVAWVHAMPITEETFDAFFLPLAKTYTEVFAQGLGALAGARLAMLMLQRVAQQTGDWEGVQQGLLPEINRLSTVVVPRGRWTPERPKTETDAGMVASPESWEPIALEQAVKAGVLTPDDVKEATNVLVFFTCCSWVPFKADRPMAVGALAGFYQGRSTPLSSTEFAASLPTSIATGNSGAKEIRSSIPS